MGPCSYRCQDRTPVIIKAFARSQLTYLDISRPLSCSIFELWQSDQCFGDSLLSKSELIFTNYIGLMFRHVKRAHLFGKLRPEANFV